MTFNKFKNMDELITKSGAMNYTREELINIIKSRIEEMPPDALEDLAYKLFGESDLYNISDRGKEPMEMTKDEMLAEAVQLDKEKFINRVLPEYKKERLDDLLMQLESMAEEELIDEEGEDYSGTAMDRVEQWMRLYEDQLTSSEENLENI